jgi:hypothetical protein
MRRKSDRYVAEADTAATTPTCRTPISRSDRYVADADTAATTPTCRTPISRRPHGGYYYFRPHGGYYYTPNSPNIARGTAGAGDCVDGVAAHAQRARARVRYATKGMAGDLVDGVAGDVGRLAEVGVPDHELDRRTRTS